MITKVKLLYPDSKMPEKAHDSDIGFDLFTHTVEYLVGNTPYPEIVKVYTGIAIEPTPGYYFILSQRSSSYKKGIILHNGIGIIDPSYRGEIIGVFRMMPGYEKIENQERLLQIIPQMQITSFVVKADELSNTDRGDGGFGSSGK